MKQKGVYALLTENASAIKNSRRFTVLLYIIPLAFYLFFAFYDGVVWCADSDSYVIMHECREPLYPTFLAALRAIFGVQDKNNEAGNIYLFVAVIIQSLLAAIAASVLADFIRKACNLGKTLSLIVLSVPMFTSLLNRFVASRGSMYSNSILTEGLAISLFLLFMRFCMGYVITGKRYDLVIGALISTIGILTRKQMYIMLILLIIAIVWRGICDRTDSGKTALLLSLRNVILTLVIVLSLTTLLDNLYNRIAHGSYHTHTEDNRFLSTMAFYTATREDVKYIPEKYQDLFLEIYDICDSNGWTMTHAPKNWYDATSHFGDNYDHIQLDTMEIILAGHHTEWNLENMSYTEEMDVVRSEFNKSLIPHEIPALSKVVFNNFLEGLVNTVAQKRKILCLYTAIIYPVYILLWAYLIRKWDKTDIIRKNVLTISAICLIAVLLNVTVVSMVIFPQTRYTIYGMPIFYISLLIMINELFRQRSAD